MATVKSPPARLKFWGVRGSIPVPGVDTLRYGGNTTCVEVRADNEIIVLDAGTGIRALGSALIEEFRSRPIKVSLLISHMHWDHIQGFPFFLPSYNVKNLVRIFGYNGAGPGLRDILVGQMATPLFPVQLQQLPGRIEIKRLKKFEFNIGKVRVHAKAMNHPGVCVGYRLETSHGSIAFLPDNELYNAGMLHSAKPRLSRAQTRKKAAEARADLVEFLRDCDVLILDTQYTDEEYKAHIGWGHGALSAAVALALDARVGKLLLFHHDPCHDDAAIDGMAKAARKLVAKSGRTLHVEAAREGAELILTARKRRAG